MVLLSAAQFLCHPGAFAAAGRNTDIKVESSELNEADLDARLEAKMNRSKDDKFGLYMNDSTAFDFNEDGDPNVRMRY